VIHEVVREINLPLDEVGGPDPWAYATYQRGTASNAYSRVHWSYFEPSGGDADCPRDDCGTPGGISCYPRGTLADGARFSDYRKRPA
jgi:hypothetical protein